MATWSSRVLFRCAAIAAVVSTSSRVHAEPTTEGVEPSAAEVDADASIETTTPSTDPNAADTLAGIVRDAGAEGRGIASARVLVRDANGVEHVTTTDAEGRFVVLALPIGPTHVEVGAAGHITDRLDTQITETRQPELVVWLDVSADKTVTLVVRARSAADELRESAKAVDVVETETAKRQSADLGEVLARSEGVGVRRSGGLGSQTRFSLNGLTDDQIRFFVDGIPMDFAGYPFGIANIPVGLVDRVEIYRGVVPITYGADALGGAVDVVTDANPEGTHADVSYQVGSFDTHRLGLSGSHHHKPSGLLVRAAGFFDYSRNDYTIDVEVPDDTGRLSPATVRRFHDRYRAGGGNVEIGVIDRPWAKRLLLKVFSTAYDTQLQHNVVMTVPYGDATFSETGTGATVRYENESRNGLSLRAVAGYAWQRSHFLDVGECVYDWFGRCVRERTQAGEIATPPRDQMTWQHSAYGRVVGGWRMHPQHEVRVAFSPTFTTRTGDERRQRNPDDRDPLTAQRDVFAFVSGIEYQIDVARNRVQNVAFFKDYVQALRTEEPVVGIDTLRRRDRTSHRVGIGDGVRVHILDWMYAKASYEWATRLPTPDEIFGDNQIVLANLELKPEASHNANLSLDINARETKAGGWRLGLGGFLRDASNLIVMLGSDRSFTYQNVFTARSLGVDAAAGWTSPGDYFSIDGNVTYQSFRNSSSKGTFADFEGDRIPNRPYLFANGTAVVGFSDVMTKDDRLSFTWMTRYVHKFFRSWESAGITQYKQSVPNQTSHAVAATYVVRGKRVELGSTLEVQNLFNADLFDFFGVQRPGRAFYAKLTLGY